MTSPDPAPPLAVPLRLAASTVLLRAASVLIRAADAVSPHLRSDPSGEGDRQRATQSSRPAGNRQGPAQDGADPLLSDGYLADAETWEPTGPLSGGIPAPVVALMRIDRVIGNEYALSPTGLGRVRGLVLTALSDWHRTRHQQIAIDPDPRARQVPGLGRVIEPPITGPPRPRRPRGPTEETR